MAINSAAELRRKIKRSGITVHELAQSAGIARARLRDFRRGLLVPTLQELDRIEALIRGAPEPSSRGR